MTKFGKNAPYIKPAKINAHKIRESFQKIDIIVVKSIVEKLKIN